VEALQEALFADSAAKDLKFIDTDVLAEVRELEREIDEIKRGLAHMANPDDVKEHVTRFLLKGSGV